MPHYKSSETQQGKLRSEREKRRERHSEIVFFLYFRSHDVLSALRQAIKMGRTIFVDLLGAILEKT